MISFIIPTFNRYHQLMLLVKSLTEKVEAHHIDYEMIIVDDCSKDETRTYTPENKKIRVLRNLKNAGPCVARNRGAKMAQGRYIAFIDDDCQITDQYLARVQIHIADQKYDLIGGPAHTLKSEKRNIISNYLDQIGFLKNPCFDASGNYACFPSSNILVRKNAFELLGGFDPGFNNPGGEDNNLTIRAVRQQMPIVFDYAMPVLHDNSASLKQFLFRYYFYGKGNRINQKLLRLTDIDAGFWIPSKGNMLGKFFEYLRYTQLEQGKEFSSNSMVINMIHRLLAFSRVTAYEFGGLLHKGLTKSQKGCPTQRKMIQS